MRARVLLPEFGAAFPQLQPALVERSPLPRRAFATGRSGRRPRAALRLAPPPACCIARVLVQRLAMLAGGSIEQRRPALPLLGERLAIFRYHCGQLCCEPPRLPASGQLTSVALFEGSRAFGSLRAQLRLECLDLLFGFHQLLRQDLNAILLQRRCCAAGFIISGRCSARAPDWAESKVTLHQRGECCYGDTEEGTATAHENRPRHSCKEPVCSFACRRRMCFARHWTPIRGRNHAWVVVSPDRRGPRLVSGTVPARLMLKNDDPPDTLCVSIARRREQRLFGLFLYARQAKFSEAGICDLTLINKLPGDRTKKCSGAITYEPRHFHSDRRSVPLLCLLLRWRQTCRTRGKHWTSNRR